MISIEEKINIFRQEIQATIDKRRQEEISKAREEAAQRIKKSDIKLEEDLEQIKKKYDRLESRRINKILNESTSTSKEILQNLHKEVKENFFETVIKEAGSYLNSDEYKKYYVKSLKELEPLVDGTGSIKFYTLKQDEDKFKSIILEMLEGVEIDFKELDPKDIGGFSVVDSEERFKYDFTLLDLLDENRKKIDFYLKEALKEDNNE